MLAPVELPRELKERIRKVAEDWIPEQAPWIGHQGSKKQDQERLTPWVEIKSRYKLNQQSLRWKGVTPDHSPWEDQWTADRDGHGGDQYRAARLIDDMVKQERDFADRLQDRSSLPIRSVKDQLLAAVKANQVTLVAAETGSGKSTQVPQYLLDDAVERGAGLQCHVVCTQPRRLAAVSLASRIAWERGQLQEKTDRIVKFGEIGHVVRWDEKPSRPWGSICLCTVGSLLPRLSKLGASHIVVDEAHTRDVHTDLLLTVVQELLRNAPELRVLVMSATLDLSRWQAYFKGLSCGVVLAHGRPHPVLPFFLEDTIASLNWRPKRQMDEKELPAGAYDGVDYNRSYNTIGSNYSHMGWLKDVVNSMPEYLIPLHLITDLLIHVSTWQLDGGVLVFLPGWQEIAMCEAMLSKEPALQCYDVIRLHSSVPPAEQQRALDPPRPGYRKVILSTDIAETSVTIPDVLCVIDSGVARVKHHTYLEVQWASQANLFQRRGRAGRVRSGFCYHLITRNRFEQLQTEPTPEMQRVTLNEVVLSVCDLGLGNPPDSKDAYDGIVKFLQKAPDPPEDKAVWQSFQELQTVGALDDEGVMTDLGALLVRLPLPASVGAALFMAGMLGIEETACQVAATLDTREPWARRGSDGEQNPGAALQGTADDRNAGNKQYLWSDTYLMADALRDFEQNGAWKNDWQQRKFCQQRSLILPIMQQMVSAREQLLRALRDMNMGSWAWCSSGDGGTGGDPDGEAEDWPPDFLETSWPLLQAMLTFSAGWNVAEYETGRKVNTGAAKPARLNRTSAFNCGRQPPSPLLVYSDLNSGSGGRVVRGATMVTPHQVLLYGGRSSLHWMGDHVLIEGWLQVQAERESAFLLGALRAVTLQVLQEGAIWALRSLKFDGQQGPRELRQRISSWRRCVRDVCNAALPPRACGWDCPVPVKFLWARAAEQEWEDGERAESGTELAIAVQSQQQTLSLEDYAQGWNEVGDSQGGSSSSTALAPRTTAQRVAHAEVPPGYLTNLVPAVSPLQVQLLRAQQPEVQLHSVPQALAPQAFREPPIGWRICSDGATGSLFFLRIDDGSRRLDMPLQVGRHGRATEWRWALQNSTRCFIRVGSDVELLEEPDVGDGLILPRGWDSSWNHQKLRPAFWRISTQERTWEWPTTPDG